LVPFIGAGIPMGLHHARTGRLMLPSWRSFLIEAAAGLTNRADIIALIAEDRLTAAALLIKQELRGGWLTLLRNKFVVNRTDAIEQELERLRMIWRVSDGLVITTNYDDTLQWGRSDREPILNIFGLESTPDLSTIIHASKDAPVLWHLHGRISYPDDIVLTDDSYEQLYDADSNPAAARRHRAALMCLRAIPATQSLLFLGCSLTDPGVNKALIEVRELFGAPHEHFMVCLGSEEEQTRKRLDDTDLRHITLLPVANYADALDELLRDLSGTPDPAILLQVAEPAWSRRRCRTIVAGGPEFEERLRPLIAEHAPVDAVLFLGELLEDDGLSTFQRAIARALKYELEGRIEQMLQATTAYLAKLPEDTVERLNLMLFHAIALEKSIGRGRVREAVTTLDEIIQHPATPPELLICAKFNRDVCREKLDDDVSFGHYIAQQGFRFSSGELIWTKGFNMEMVRCGRRGIEFRYADLLDAAIGDELADASTGFGKTVTNWGHLSGAPIEGLVLERLNEVAARATPSQRIPMLSFIESITPDQRLRDAINQILESHGHSPVLQGLIQTRRLHGRFTLYGEYLMHAHAGGYLAPTPMYLQGTADLAANPAVWDAGQDTVREWVRRLGLDVLDNISGTLPLGLGFAGSTVLQLLHLREQVNDETRLRIMTILDWMAQGFQPSGADQAAVLAQKPGFYLRDAWQEAPALPLNGVFVAVAGAATMPLRKVQSVLRPFLNRLAPIANALTEGIITNGVLDEERFAEYCRVLAHAGIYTAQQRAVVESAHSAGLSAKAIGGLHNKALLVLGPDLERFVAELPDSCRVVGDLRAPGTSQRPVAG